MLVKRNRKPRGNYDWMTVLALLTQWSERESQCFTARSTRITHPAVSSSRTRYVRGAQEGAAQGEREAGPVGAVVGGAVGAVTGTIGGILGVDDRRHFHEYVARQHRPSYRYNDLRVGAVLPPDGMTYYDIPGEYHVQGYRYAFLRDLGGFSRLCNIAA